MSNKKCVREKYLYLSAMLRAREAKMLTREKAERMIANRETDKPLTSLIPSEYRDQKAVKIAIARLCQGRYRLHGAQ